MKVKGGRVGWELAQEEVCHRGLVQQGGTCVPDFGGTAVGIKKNCEEKEFITQEEEEEKAALPSLC